MSSNGRHFENIENISYCVPNSIVSSKAKIHIHFHRPHKYLSIRVQSKNLIYKDYHQGQIIKILCWAENTVSNHNLVGNQPKMILLIVSNFVLVTPFCWAKLFCAHNVTTQLNLGGTYITTSFHKVKNNYKIWTPFPLIVR